MFGEDCQPLSGLSGQQCRSDVGIDVKVIGICVFPKGECNWEFSNGAHGGSVDGLRSNC